MPGAAGEDSMVRSYLEWLIEIRLRGLVLPVGRIKEKVVAAARAGLTHVLLPARDRIDFRFTDHADEAIEAALAASGLAAEEERLDCAVV